MGIFFIIVLSSIITLLITIVFNKKAYCFVFLHKKWKLWEHYIRNHNKFEYDYSINGAHFFKMPHTNVSAVIWGKGGCSIHYDKTCMLSTFDNYHSNKMKKLLLKQM